MGERWRNIHIWQDKWLPEQLDFKACLPSSKVDMDQRVSSLLNDSQSSWNRDLINNLFPLIEVK